MRLDYCNSLYFGVSQSSLSRLQVVQNWKRKQIFPILASLHWLPVLFRVHFKMILFVIMSLNGLAPPSLSCCMCTPLPGCSGQLTSCSRMCQGHGESSEGTELLQWQLLGCGTRCHCMLNRRLHCPFLNFSLKPMFSHWPLTQFECSFYLIYFYLVFIMIVFLSYLELFYCVYIVRFICH